jgi:hypothetical protein
MLEFFEIQIPGLISLLPFFGTIGLIVLEQAPELEINRSKTRVIRRFFLIALSFTSSLAYYWLSWCCSTTRPVNIIPFSVI